jgi:hypothetical protein
VALQRLVTRFPAPKISSLDTDVQNNRFDGLFWAFFILAHFSEGGIDRGNESFLHKTSLEQASCDINGDWKRAFRGTLRSRFPHGAFQDGHAAAPPPE